MAHTGAYHHYDRHQPPHFATESDFLTTFARARRGAVEYRGRTLRERPLRGTQRGGARQAQARYGAMPYNRSLVPSGMYCDVQTVLHMEPFPIFYCCRGVGTIFSGGRIILII